MPEFSKIILLLVICISILIDGSEERVVVKSNAGIEKRIGSFLTSETSGDVSAQRTKRKLFDQILYGLFDYLDYSDEDESAEDEKYLICRNCTILISPDKPPIQATVVPTPTMRNEGAKPASSATNAPATTAPITTTPVQSDDSPISIAEP